MAAGYCDTENNIHICNDKYVSENGKDLCVMCLEETEYDSSTPTEFRENYTELGQLCFRCFDGFYLEDVGEK